MRNDSCSGSYLNSSANCTPTSSKRSLRFEALEERVYLDQGGLLAELPKPIPPAPSANIDLALLDTDPANQGIVGSSIQVPETHIEYPFRGAGYTVAVLDSGIDYNHPAFAGGTGFGGSRIVAGYDFVNGAEGDYVEADSQPGPDNDPIDPYGHGTNVAGIIGSADDIYTGVAPEADLISLRVLDANGSGNWDWVAQALQWVIDHHEEYNIVAVNMSLGGGNYDSSVDFSLVNQKIERLDELNIVITASAGNNYYTLDSQLGLQYPAVHESVIAVGATFEKNVGAQTWSSGAKDFSSATSRLVSFTQRSDKLALVAPGALIKSTYLSNGGKEIYTNFSGTSQASPFVAGAAVLIHEALDSIGMGELATDEYILDLLQSTGNSIFDGDDEDYNVHASDLEFIEIDLLAALRAVTQTQPHIIRDDGDTEYTENGVWHTSSLGGWGKDSRYSTDPNASATFEFAALPSGTLELAVHFAGQPNNTTAAVYDIYLQDQLLESITINQKPGTTGWQTLGTYTVQSGAIRVVVRNGGSGTLRTDAIRLTSLAPSSFLVDRPAADYKEKGSWRDSSLAGIAGSRYSTDVAAEVQAQFRHVPEGLYQLQTFLPAATNSTDQAEYLITVDNKYWGTVRLNQSQLETGWQKLGQFYTSTGSIHIQVRNAGRGTLRADAFQLEALLTPTRTLDNGDSAYRELSGNWSNSSLGGFENDSRYSNDQNAKAVYDFGSLIAGAYELRLQLPANTSSTTQALYIIREGDSIIGQIPVNQKTFTTNPSNPWKSLGTFRFTGNGRVTVTVSNQGSGRLRTDALQLRPQLPAQLVIDDGSNFYAELSGFWQFSSLGGHDGDSRYSNDPNAVASYQFSTIKSGTYMLQAYLSASTYSSNSATYEIYIDNQLSRSITIDQRTASGWKHLAQLKVPANSKVTVRLRQTGQGGLRADAMQLLPAPSL